MNLFNVDHHGFDLTDRIFLHTIVDKLSGVPVGCDTMDATMSEEKGTIEDVIELYLMQQGFITRTARGRVATSKAYQHLGLPHPQEQCQPETTEIHQPQESS